MEFRQMLTILRDLFMPQPRNACPHCGGIRCIGACQFNDKPPVESGRGKTGQAQHAGAPDAQAHAHAAEDIGATAPDEKGSGAAGQPGDNKAK